MWPWKSPWELFLHSLSFPQASVTIPSRGCQFAGALMPGKLVLAVEKGKIFEETDKDGKAIMGG